MQIEFYAEITTINLAITFTCKNASVTNFMNSLTSVSLYFANSSKRDQYFERFIDYYKDELSMAAISCSHVIAFSKTRWVKRCYGGDIVH